MKKYIIRNADGSEQTVMQAVHNSREEAGRELMRYLSYHNESWDVDNHLSPFDFVLEEVERPQVNEVVTDFKRARKALGLNIDYELPKYMTNVARLVEVITPTHIEALIAINKLFTIAEAWNKEDGFVPDFSDREQDKWFPWFKYDKNTARFVYAFTNNSSILGYAYFGSRLCFKTLERAAQFGKQFVDLYNEVFL